MNPTIDLILSHRSIRQFTPEPISASQLDQILSAAQSASSSSFLQANSIIRVTDKGLRATLAELAGHQAYVAEAAEFLLFCADYQRHSQIVPEAQTGFVEQLMIGAIDGALMAQNTLLAAQSLGLGGVYIGGIRNNPAAVSETMIFSLRSPSTVSTASASRGSDTTRVPGEEASMVRFRWA